MAKKSDSLKVRQALKARKPKFLRQDAHKKVKLAKNWRNPRGIDNKVRLNKRGYRRSPSVGWKSPRDVRGMSAAGLPIVVVSTPKQLAVLDKTRDIMLSGMTGQKKALEIVKLAKEKGLTIVNVKDKDAYISKIEDIQKQKKAEKAKKEKAKKDAEKAEKEKARKEAEKKERAAKAAEEPKAETPEKKPKAPVQEQAPDEATLKKEEEKKEKDKILTQRT